MAGYQNPFDAYTYPFSQQQHQQQQQQSNQGQASGSNVYSDGGGGGGVGLEGYYGYVNGQQSFQPQQQYYPAQFQQDLQQSQAPQYTVQPGAIHGNGHANAQTTYDPFQLGALTGPGITYNPVPQQYLQQQYYPTLQSSSLSVPDQTTHRPSLQSTVTPPESQPGSNNSPHRSIHSVTPDRHVTLSPDAEGHVSPQNGSASGPARTERQKEGPVKAACLSCRQKKAKCDGVKPVCTQCSKKNLECVYVKSKRGGARKKREVVAPSALQEFLKKLDVLLSVHDPSLSPGTTDSNEDTTNVVRQFASRDEVFRCYYNEVHPFLPVMPPRHYLAEIATTLLPESPFLLAAETILVLVPHPLDPNPKSSHSKRLRTSASAALGQRTMKAIEAVLASNERSMEVPQAFAMLSMWEWGNAGNLQLNRQRANQAIQVLMEMGVNELDKGVFNGGRALEGQDWRKDMARRTWWAAYAGQMTAAIISGNEPVLGPDDPRVLIDYPVTSLSDTSWPNWINAMRQCVRVFSVVNRVYASVQAEGGGGQAWGGSGSNNEALGHIDQELLKRRMLEVDAEVMDLLQRAEQSAVIELVPGGEEEVVRNQQLSARLGLAVTHIHIHRQQAFPEVSLFSKRICGLPQAPDFTATGQAQQQQQGQGQQQLQIDVEPVNNSTLPTSVDMRHTLSNDFSKMSADADGSGATDTEDPYDFVDEMWQPETYPEDLPAPWFTNRGGAGSLWAPTAEDPEFIPIISPPQPVDTTPSREGRRPSVVSSGQGTNKPHKAWGVDKDDKASPAPEGLGISNAMQVFPPGISLARCATAAHTIVRLEVLHRSAVIAMWDGPPKWLPFCSCGLVTGAYAFLLLALAVQAENEFATPEEAMDRSNEVEALLTNVKVILAGLEAYGVMWAGIEVMAGEVRAALEAASRLPYEIRGRIEAVSSTASPPGSQGDVKK